MNLLRSFQKKRNYFKKLMPAAYQKNQAVDLQVRSIIPASEHAESLFGSRLLGRGGVGPLTVCQSIAGSFT